MTRHAHLSPEPDPVAKDGAASDTHLGDDVAIPSDMAVMPDVNEVVDLRPCAHDRIAQRPSVDRRIGSDLDIVFKDASADLLEFHRAIGTVRIPKAIRRNARTAV